MNDQDVNVFIDSVVNYFNQVSGERPEVFAPYLRGEESPALDFTGIIGISGPHRGAVYFTSGADQLSEILRGLGEPELSFDNLEDLCGEVANTIAGNARRVFGREFVISVPHVVWGHADKVQFPPHARSFVVPIAWRRFESRLIISLETTTPAAAN
jgi:chemotaxis protein CheX